VPFVASSTVAPDLLVGANASHVIPEENYVRRKTSSGRCLSLRRFM
jgi:hypothetical protein